METAEQTEAIQIHFLSRFSVVNNIFRIMADVCEAFSFFCVFSGLPKIRVHSCSFVVSNKLSRQTELFLIGELFIELLCLLFIDKIPLWNIIASI